MSTNILPKTIATLILTLGVAHAASAEAPARYRQVSYNAESSVAVTAAVSTTRSASNSFVNASERPITLLIDPNLASYQGGGEASAWMSARPRPAASAPSTIPARPRFWSSAPSAMQSRFDDIKLR
ncbi:hypothetical protein [Planctomyces sp. SH-PL14]|uniref:hypothetical protein n=1 Tax=Planctomyces sp. SH-PL14 TaxID=1632864 RepID=UPI00078EA216|nr:hypothetical protein [Planctomyces sp. SH-PL14]AMV21733.1 hypothetical protein VT03_27780 [Planctomyces sp. SH-PL14]